MTRRPAAVPPSAPAPPWTPFHAALCLMLLTYVWRLQDLIPVLGRLKLTVLASVAALGLFLVGGRLAHLPGRLRHPVFRVVLVILALAVLSVPGAVYPGYTFRFLTDDHVKTLLFMAMLAASIRSPHDVERYMAVHVAGATAYCLTVLSRYSPGEDGRLAGLIYYDANDLAMVLVCTLPMLVYLARPGRPAVVRLVLVGALGLFVVSIVQTGSRGGFLGLVAVFGVMLVRFTTVSRGQRIGAAALVAAGLAATADGQFWGRIASLANPSEDYNWSGNSANGRMEVWKRGVGYMLEYPVFGVGAAGFGAAEGRLSPMAQSFDVTGRGFKWSAAHNSFVQVGAELGVPGLIAFLALLAVAFRATRRIAAGARGARAPPAAATMAQVLMAALVGYVVSGFFLSQAYSAYLHTVLAMIVGLEAVSAASPAPAAAPVPRASLPRALRPRPAGRGGLVLGAAGHAEG